MSNPGRQSLMLTDLTQKSNQQESYADICILHEKNILPEQEKPMFSVLDVAPTIHPKM